MHHNKVFLDPRGKSTYGLGVCGRCGNKLFLEELFPDPNFPGLMVCKDDIDVLDPYRLPARETEQIALPFNRPDRNIDVPAVPNPNLVPVWPEDP